MQLVKRFNPCAVLKIISLIRFFSQNDQPFKIVCISIIFHLGSFFQLAQVLYLFFEVIGHRSHWSELMPFLCFWVKKALFMDNFSNIHSKTDMHKLKSMRHTTIKNYKLKENKLIKRLNPIFGHLFYWLIDWLWSYTLCEEKWMCFSPVW